MIEKMRGAGGNKKMLKWAGVIIGLALVMQPAISVAEQPERVLPEAAISVGIGQSQTFRFKSNFTSAGTVTEGVVEVLPQSDRVLTLVGKAVGGTILIVRGDDGREIYSASVQVTPEPGHVVRLYGKPGVPDYVGFFCTDVACGRADKELGGSREPSRTEQTIIHRSGNPARD